MLSLQHIDLKASLPKYVDNVIKSLINDTVIPVQPLIDSNETDIQPVVTIVYNLLHEILEKGQAIIGIFNHTNSSKLCSILSSP